MKGNPVRIFVVIDPEATQQIALLKAMLIAKLGNCHIHAFLCCYADLRDHGESSSSKELKLRTLNEAEQRLETLMEPCTLCDVPFSTEVVWHSRWYEIALHAVAKNGADLVVKSSFHHSKAKRLFNKTSDYYLMHHCSCPILFTHKAERWESDNVLACIDLEADDLRHMRLNNVVVRNARGLANTLGMTLSIASVYRQSINTDLLPIEKSSPADTAEALVDIYGIDRAGVFLRQGDTLESLRRICVEFDPSIVVLGSIARTGISGLLIGNTAENLLDMVDSDLLIVN